ncbi:MAG: fibronectin type III domain-containing protein, partial [Acidobacteriaceae bacterium]
MTWSTDVPATAQLAYGTTKALGQLSPLQTAMTASHGVTLTGLISGTTYYFVAQSIGADGATGYSAVMSFTTTGTAPAGPPVISNVAVSSITNTSATITWTTDQASSSLVNFGATTGYGSASPLNPTLVTSHSVTLTGLTLGTTYDFDVVSVNSGAMSSISGNSSFLTTSVVPLPPVISNVAVSSITNTSATITWTTDQASSSLVNFGTTTGYGSASPLNPTLV